MDTDRHGLQGNGSMKATDGGWKGFQGLEEKFQGLELCFQALEKSPSAHVQCPVLVMPKKETNDSL